MIDLLSATLILCGAELALGGGFVYSKLNKHHFKKIANKQIKISKEEYKSDISDYNKYLEEYSSYIKALDLNDLNLIIKIIYDQHNMVEYIDEDKNEIFGYERVSLLKNKKGLCRNFADDFTAKINAINPAYNAYNINIYALFHNDYTVIDTIDIERKPCVEGQEETFENDCENTNESNSEHYILRSKKLDEKIVGFVKKYIGNHKVSAIDIPGKKIKLVVDPQNLLIGVLNNGKIKLFNHEGVNIFKYKFNGTFRVDGKSGKESRKNHREIYYDMGDISFEELNSMYGYEAQKEALEYIKSLPRPKV